jgi:hypothetical protein
LKFDSFSSVLRLDPENSPSTISMGNEIMKSTVVEKEPTDEIDNTQQEQTNSFENMFFLGGNGHVLTEKMAIVTVSDQEKRDRSTAFSEVKKNDHLLDEVEIVASETTDEVYFVSAAGTSGPADREDLPEHLPLELERLKYSPQRQDFVIERHSSNEVDESEFFDAQESYAINDLEPLDELREIAEHPRIQIHLLHSTSVFMHTDETNSESWQSKQHEARTGSNIHEIPLITPEKALSLMDDAIQIHPENKSDLSLTELIPLDETTPNKTRQPDILTTIDARGQCTRVNSVNRVESEVGRSAVHTLSMKKSISEEEIPCYLSCCDHLFSTNDAHKTSEQASTTNTDNQSTNKKILRKHDETMSLGDEYYGEEHTIEDTHDDHVTPPERSNIITSDIQDITLCSTTAIGIDGSSGPLSIGPRIMVIASSDYVLVGSTQGAPMPEPTNTISKDAITMIQDPTDKELEEPSIPMAVVEHVVKHDLVDLDTPSNRSLYVNLLPPDKTLTDPATCIENKECIVNNLNLDMVLDHEHDVNKLENQSPEKTINHEEMIDLKSLREDIIKTAVDQPLHEHVESQRPLHMDMVSQSINRESTDESQAKASIKETVVNEEDTAGKVMTAVTDAPFPPKEVTEMVMGNEVNVSRRKLVPRSGDLLFIPCQTDTRPQLIPNGRESSTFKRFMYKWNETNMIDPAQMFESRRNLAYDKRRVRAIQILQSSYGHLENESPQKKIISVVQWHQTLSQFKHTACAQSMKTSLHLKNYFVNLSRMNHGVDKTHSDIDSCDSRTKKTNSRDIFNTLELDYFYERDYVQNPGEVLRNKVTVDHPVSIVQSLLSLARADMGYFSNLIRNIVEFSSQENLPKFGADQEVVSSVNIKNEVDILAKARCKYGNDCSRVKDVLRGYIIFLDEKALCRALLYLHKYSQSNGDFCIVRLKNLFRTLFDGSLVPSNLFTGYRHILVNVRLKSGLITGMSFILIKVEKPYGRIMLYILVSMQRYSYS